MAGFDLGNYNTVAERMTEFFQQYPDGSLQQVKYEMLEVPVYARVEGEVVQTGMRVYVVYTAAAYRNADDMKPGIGTAWEPIPGPTQFTRDSEIQNAETAAWGRAILAVGAAGTQKGVASRDEVAARRGDS